MQCIKLVGGNLASVSEDKGFEQEPKQVDAVPDDDASLPAKGTPKII